MAYPYVSYSPVMPVYGNYTQPSYVAPAPVPVPQVQAQPQQQQQQQAQPQQPQQSEQLVSGGFVVIPTEEDAKRYPVAPGNLVTFKIENEPIMIEKSMGRSQFSSPEYKYYKLCEYNNQTETPSKVDNVTEDVSNSDIEFMKKSFEHIEKRLESLSDSYVELKKTLSKKQDIKPVKKEDSDAA